MEGAKMIAELLKINTTITELNLGWEGGKKKWIVTWIGAEGARMINEGLKSNSTLTKLNLGCDVK